ncbi:MAG: vWA domain-containing protein, partial [Aureliella sp.]
QQARPDALDGLLIAFEQRLDATAQPARRSVRLPSAARELADERSGPAENTALEQSASDCAAEATATDEPDEDAIIDCSVCDEGCEIELSIAGAGRRRAATEEEVQRSRSLTRSMLSGFSLSLFGHVALLGVLFAITLKLPGQSASLGSQIVSVAAPAEEVELSAEFGATEPVEMELAETIDSSLDEPSLASLQEAALSEIELVAVEADSLGGAPSAASGPSASAGAMLSAAAASHGDRGGGRAQSGGRGARGGPAMSTSGGKFFGAGAGGNFFCYVVDSSGSMRGAAWESAKAELARSIGTLSEKQRFYIVFFAKEIAAIPEPGGREPAAHGLEASKENIEHARRWIETVKLDRGGPPNAALELAISREPDAIYLLTDGVTQVDVCGFLREKNRTSDIVSGEQVRVPIHAIAYRSLDGQQLLRQLAQENAGQFHYVPAPK